MEIKDEFLTSVDLYHASYYIKIDKPIDFNLLEEFCNIKEAEYFNLDLYDDEDTIAQWESSKEKTIQEFLDNCKSSNICIKDPLYWDLLIDIDNEDVNIGYEGEENTIYFNMEGRMGTIKKVLSIIEKIDKKNNVIKVVK